MVMRILRSRKVAKWVLIALLILIIPAFVLWGAGSMSKSPSAIGTIDGQKVMPKDFLESMKATRIQILLSHYGNFENMNKILKNRSIMNQLAWERLIMLKAAEKKRYKVTNRDVLVFIASIPLFQKKGTFDKTFYDYILRNNLSMEPREFEELVRQNIIIQTFRNDLLKDLAVSDDEAKENYALMNDQMDFSYVFVDKNIFKDQVSSSDKDAEQYFQDNPRFFYTPEKAEFEVVEISFEDDVEKSSIENRVRKIYAALVTDPENMESIAASEGLLYSSPEAITATEMIPGVTYTQTIQETTAGLSQGELSPPLSSGSGNGEFYIIRKKGTIAPAPLPYAQAKDSIVEMLTTKEQLTLAKEKADTIYLDLSSDNISLEDVATQLNSKVKPTGTVSYSDYIETLGPAQHLISLAKHKKNGTRYLEPVQVQNGFILVRIDKTTPADTSSFNDTKESIKATLLMSKQMKAMDEWLRNDAPQTELKKLQP